MALQDDLPWLVAPTPVARLWRDESVRWRLNAAAAVWARERDLTDAHWATTLYRSELRLRF